MDKNNGNQPGKKINASHKLFKPKNAVWNSSVALLDELEKLREQRLELQAEREKREKLALGVEIHDSKQKSD